MENEVYSRDESLVHNLKITVIHHINGLKKMTVSTDTEKAVDKIQHAFMIKKKKKHNNKLK